MSFDIFAQMKKDRFAEYCNIELVEAKPGSSIARMLIRDYHRNSVGIVHGGATFTLADFAFAAASNAYGTVAVSITSSISFTRAAAEGFLIAVATEEALGRKTATYTVRVTDSEDNLIAIFQGMVYRKSEQL